MGATLNRGKSRQDYGTPIDFITAVKGRFGIEEFGWDLAASAENTKAPHFYSEAQDALNLPWNVAGKDWAWLNPPFGNIEPWVSKAADTRGETTKIMMLVPASVGANWWNFHVHDQAHVIFLNGRITFEGQEDPYPKDCALLLYTPYCYGGYEIWAWK